MKIEYFKTYSSYLDREMEFKVYGHCGRPMLVFPCQNGRFFDYEDQKMIVDAFKYSALILLIKKVGLLLL